jgi:hypothetical protein
MAKVLILIFAAILFLFNPIYAQDNFMKMSNSYLTSSNIEPDLKVDIDFSFLNHAELVYVYNANTMFSANYLISEEGDTYDQGFSHPSNFVPDSQRIVISGCPNITKDSFNPYGARDGFEAVIMGSINSFFRLINKKEK